MTSKEITSWRFDLYYDGKIRNIGIGVMAYLYYITMDNEDYMAESIINRELRGWYPIRNTSLKNWHLCKEALVRMGILKDVMVYCPDPEYKGANIFNDDLRKIRSDNIDQFKLFKKCYDDIDANYYNTLKS